MLRDKKRRIPLLDGVFGTPLDRHPQGSEVCLSIALTALSFFAFSFWEKAKVDGAVSAMEAQLPSQWLRGRDEPSDREAEFCASSPSGREPHFRKGEGGKIDGTQKRNY